MRALSRDEAEMVRTNRNGWSQRQWARVIGVSRSTVARVMSGRCYREPLGSHYLPQRKLTDRQVREIRENREGLTDRQRAARLGVHANTVSHARWYLTHKDIP